MLDHNRFVQEAAVSALATMAETAGHEDAMRVLGPYLKVRVCLGVCRCAGGCGWVGGWGWGYMYVILLFHFFYFI